MLLWDDWKEFYKFRKYLFIICWCVFVCMLVVWGLIHYCRLSVRVRVWSGTGLPAQARRSWERPFKGCLGGKYCCWLVTCQSRSTKLLLCVRAKESTLKEDGYKSFSKNICHNGDELVKDSFQFDIKLNRKLKNSQTFFSFYCIAHKSVLIQIDLNQPRAATGSWGWPLNIVL